MASRADEDRQPFHNPFRAALRELRSRLPSAEQTEPAESENENALVDEPPRSDAELFEDAVSGTRRLDDGPTRVRSAERVPSTIGRTPESEGDLDLLADAHFDVRFSDQFIRGRANGVNASTLAKLERGEFSVRSHVDLHGMPLDDARRAVDEFLADRQRRGERCVLVITGKGKNSPGQQGVLREGIPHWLARGPSARRILAFVTARSCDGGEGALYVLLRRDRAGKVRIHVESGGGT
jgi:DNA-nicking Smr family endonuclease